MSEDKNPKQRNTEFGTRNLLRAFQATHPGDVAKAKKKEGLITFLGKPCAKLTPKPDGSNVIVWNYDIVTQHSVNKAAILEAFDAGGAAKVQWSL